MERQRSDRASNCGRSRPTPAVIGQSTAGAVGAAPLGVAVIGVSAVVLWLVFRNEASAHWVGRLGDRILNWVLHFFHTPASDRVERAVLGRTCLCLAG